MADGFVVRMVACSVLPIGQDTLCYGSGDGGVTVHDSDPELNKKVTHTP